MFFVVIVALAWLYVALMMALAEASSPVGSVPGAIVTFVGYGVLPVALVSYILATPARRRARKAAERAAAGGTAPVTAQATPEAAAPQPDVAAAGARASATQPDAGGEPAAAAEPGGVAPVREEP